MDATLAGIATRWVRRVAQRALACRADAAAPAARMMLNAMQPKVSQAALAVNDPGGGVGQGTGLELGDDLLDDRVVAVGGVGVNGAEGGVGDERVVAPGVEQLTLALGRCGGAQALHAAHHEAAGDLLVLGVGGERGEVDVGDLRG